jgi:hypothetical protein
MYQAPEKSSPGLVQKRKLSVKYEVGILAKKVTSESPEE